jgi:DNA primase
MTIDRKLKAKRVKIESLYKGDLKGFGTKLRGICPFHKDTSNPNFFIYTETNTWFCFAGCGGGDVIAFYMKLNNVDFKTTLKELV